MSQKVLGRPLAILLMGGSLIACFGQAVEPISSSPWNGSWQLDVKRSSPAASEQGVPQVYRFHLGPGGSANVSILWEIPELGEVVKGFTDGKRMPVHRTKEPHGMTLAVKKEGSTVLIYSVFQDGRLVGGGRMMLVDNGQSWVDLTWPDKRMDLASELVYRKLPFASEGPQL